MTARIASSWNCYPKNAGHPKTKILTQFLLRCLFQLEAEPFAFAFVNLLKLKNVVVGFFPRSLITRLPISKLVDQCSRECMYRKPLFGNNYTIPYTYCCGLCTEEIFRHQWIDLLNSKGFSINVFIFANLKRPLISFKNCS